MIEKAIQSTVSRSNHFMNKQRASTLLYLILLNNSCSQYQKLFQQKTDFITRSHEQWIQAWNKNGQFNWDLFSRLSALQFHLYSQYIFHLCSPTSKALPHSYIITLEVVFFDSVIVTQSNVLLLHHKKTKSISSRNFYTFVFICVKLIRRALLFKDAI